MSELSERLSELMFEQEINGKELALRLDISESCICDYLQGTHSPSAENLVKIADYFNRSTDFLLGREEENTNLKFKQCPSFCERLELLKKLSGKSARSLYNGAGITQSTYYDWLSEKRQPSAANLEKLADYFGLRVDFILGREN